MNIEDSAALSLAFVENPKDAGKAPGDVLSSGSIVRRGEGAERFESFLHGAGVEFALRAEPAAEPRWDWAAPSQQANRIPRGVGNDIQPGAAPASGRFEPGSETGLELQEDRLDMLAGAQPINSEVHAIAE